MGSIKLRGLQLVEIIFYFILFNEIDFILEHFWSSEAYYAKKVIRKRTGRGMTPYTEHADELACNLN